MKMTMKMTMNSTHALLNNPSLWTAFVGRTNCQERSDCLVGESLSFAFRICCSARAGDLESTLLHAYNMRLEARH